MIYLYQMIPSWVLYFPIGMSQLGSGYLSIM